MLGSHVKVCDGDMANPESVLTGLVDHPWAHFACHGSLNQKEPFESGFVLHNAKLSLRDIMLADLKNAELAFLAACNSAAGDSKGSPDEILSLSAAMQFCGYCSVIGTLWAMSDRDGPPLAKDFYTKMLEGGLDIRKSASAIHHAVDNLRSRNVRLERWVTFVHIGI